jgi:hypothetical protein
VKPKFRSTKQLLSIQNKIADDNRASNFQQHNHFSTTTSQNFFSVKRYRAPLQQQQKLNSTKD